jgi:lambda family phage portal protein
MGFRDWFRATPPAVNLSVVAAAAPSPQRGNYIGATLTRNVDFATTLETSHKEVQRDIARLRAHARDLEKNNVYAHRFHSLCATHIVGEDGVVLESGVLGNSAKPKAGWNEEIESAWEEWGRTATTNGQMDWVALQQAITKTVSMDGEILLRIVRGFPHNRFGFALQIIDADQLDWSYSQPVDKDGNRVVMGVALDKYDRPTGYYLWKYHPADYEGRPSRTLVPARDIIHIYLPERPNSVRGIPWTTSCMVLMSMLGKLYGAELNSAIAESTRLGIIKSQGLADPNDVEADSDPYASADAISTEEAQFLGIDPGLDVTFAPPTHPNSALAGFAKSLLEGIATGLGVAYHSLTGDVSQANYSSARIALLEERANWVKLQRWFIDRACNPIFEAWLETAIAIGAVKVPVVDYKRVYAPIWWPRSWEWVDPQKDITAATLAIDAGLSTYQQEIGSAGRNWRKVLQQRATEQEFIKSLGLEVVLSNKGGAPTAPKPENDVNPLLVPCGAVKQPNGTAGDKNDATTEN